MPQDKKKSTYGKMGPGLEKEYAGIPFNNAAIKRIMKNRTVGKPGAAGTTFVTKKPKTTA